jgi:GH15 family glucan-1,4-alpha-glucosidase
VRRTITEVERQLARDGLLLRYVTDDGVRGGEGTFLLCSFWLADALMHAGERDRAEELVSYLIDLANDVGLWAEELDPVTGAALGNFPQAFPHMALVSSCAQLAATEGRELPSPLAYDFSETALDYARFSSTAREELRGPAELQ